MLPFCQRYKRLYSKESSRRCPDSVLTSGSPIKNKTKKSIVNIDNIKIHSMKSSNIEHDFVKVNEKGGHDRQSKGRRRWSADEFVALFSWIFLSQGVFILVGTTTFASLLLFTANSLRFQGNCLPLCLAHLT